MNLLLVKDIMSLRLDTIVLSIHTNMKVHTQAIAPANTDLGVDTIGTAAATQHTTKAFMGLGMDITLRGAIQNTIQACDVKHIQNQKDPMDGKTTITTHTKGDHGIAAIIAMISTNSKAHPQGARIVRPRQVLLHKFLPLKGHI